MKFFADARRSTLPTQNDKGKWYLAFSIWLLVNIIWFWLIFTPAYDNRDVFYKFTADTIYYINIADNVYTKGEPVSDVYGWKISTQNLYAYVFFLFYKIFGHTEYFYIQLGYIIAIFIFNFFVFLIFQKILTKKEFFIFLPLYLINYYIFKYYTIINLLSNVFFMGFTFFIIYIFYRYLETENSIFLYLAIIIALFSTFIRVEGAATVISMFLYLMIMYKEKIIKNTIIFTVLSIPFICFQILFLYKGYKEYGYAGDIIFKNWNFVALGYGIYRVIFRVFYEIFFNDFLKDYISVRIISYLISLIINFSILLGICSVILSFLISALSFLFSPLVLSLQRESKINYFPIFFILLYIFFLLIFLSHTPSEKDPKIFILFSLYDGRYLAFVYPAICFFIVKSLEGKESRVFRILVYYPIVVIMILSIFLSLFLAIRDKVHFLKTTNANSEKINYGLNDKKILCIIPEKNSDDFETRQKIWKRNFVSYILFRKVCEYKSIFVNASYYDYVINFTEKTSIDNFKEVYTAYAWQNKFIVLRNQHK